MARRARLTKRLQRQYQSILQLKGESWFYPHPVAYGWGRPTDASAAWQAYIFAKEWGGRDGVDVKRLEGLVFRGGDPECAYRFARDVRGASVKRMQRVVVASADPDVIRVFAMNIQGADVAFLEAVILIVEVMRG